jgi:heme exporter protein D
MNWGGWGNFWEMGGYAFYVWGSYGVTVLFIAVEVVLLRARRRKALEALKRAAARQAP